MLDDGDPSVNGANQNGSNQGSKTGGGKKGEGDPVAPGASSSLGNLGDAIGALGNLIGKQDDTSKGLLGLLSGLVNKDTPVSKSITRAEQERAMNDAFAIGAKRPDPNIAKQNALDPFAFEDTKAKRQAMTSKELASFENLNAQKMFLDAFPAEVERIRTKLKDPKLSLAEKSKLTKNLRNILRSDQYSKAMAMNNPGLQFGAKLMGSLVSPVLGVAQSVDNALTSMGFIDDTTPQDVMNMDQQDVAGSPDLPIFNAEEQEQSVSVLMGVVRKNPEIFKTISKEELKNLLRNPIKFWEFYNKAKEG